VPSAGLLLLALQATVIDTVTIRAAAIEDRGRMEFEDRRRTGVGRYLTQADIAKRQVSSTSDVFRALPGVGVGRPFLVQRGIFEARCNPLVYINGMYMSDSLQTDILDTIVSPSDLAGIEIYAPGTTPVQYQRGLNACGSILFWTKDPRTTPKRRVPRGTIFAALFTVTSLVALSRLFEPD
jgi:hypothetical protein